MTVDDPTVRAKRALRAECEERRSTAGRAAGPGAGEAATGHFLAAIAPPAGCVVSGYWPMRDEFDVRPLLSRLYGLGHVCALPVVAGRGRPLAFRVWSPGTALVAGAFGTSVPPEDAAAVTPRLLLVPLLAFDAEGFRLGYGGGFYDMTLAALKARGDAAVCAVGCAFAAQEIDTVPHAATDQRLDWVVTERGAQAFA